MVLTAKETVNHRQSVRDVRWHDENTVVYVTHSGFLQLMDIRSNQGVLVFYQENFTLQISLLLLRSLLNFSCFVNFRVRAYVPGDVTSGDFHMRK